MLAAGAVTFFIVAHTHFFEQYRDLVVGGVSWTDSSKSSDFTYLYLFFALLAFFTFALASAGRFLAREASVRVKVAAYAGVLLCCGGVLLWMGTWWFGGFWVICYACVAWERQELLRNRQLSVAVLSLTLVGMSYFAGLGIAAIPGRLLWPLPGIQLGLWALPSLCLFTGACFVVLNLAFPPAIPDLDRRLELAVFGAQVLLPFCFLIFLPAHLLTPDGILALDSTIYLRILLFALMAGAWWELGRVYRRWKISAQEPHSLDSILSTLCVAAPAVYLSMFYEQFPYLSSDYFHIGEQLLPWQQFLHFHSIPYVNFAPIHGLMSYSYGFISSAFLDSTAASFLESQRFLFGIAVLITVWAARPLCGALLAAACAIPVSFLLDRDIFLAAAIFLLVNPATLRRGGEWLLTCIGVCVFSLGFNVPVGGALVAACSTPFGYLLVAWIRDHRKMRIWPIAFAAGIGALFLAWLFPVVRGWIWFATDNGSANMVANGMRFQGSLAGFPSSGDFINILTSEKFLTPFLRESWILVGIYGLYVLFTQIQKPRQERSASAMLAAWLLAVVPLVLSFYTFVRIEPTGMSRSGPVSIVVLATILPVLNARILPPFKPIVFLFIGYAFTVFSVQAWAEFGSCAQASNCPDLTRLRFKSATLLQPTPYPPGQTLIHGRDIGLPTIGRVSADAPTVNQIRALKHALSLLLRPEETYADLTDLQALYYYLDLPIPQLYVQYVASSEKMQERMIEQWRADPAPVVLIAPAQVFDGGPPSLRSYRWYRELISAYTPISMDGFSFLVDPKRLPAISLTTSARFGILDSAFFLPNLRALPSAWGRSWPLLKSRFKKVADVAVEPDPASHARVVRSAAFNLEPLNLTGGDADFATVEFDLKDRPDFDSAAADPMVTISWTSAGEKRPPKQSFLAKSATELLPLGAQPRWLLSDKLQTLRLDLVSPGNLSVFRVKGLTLWKLNDLPNESPPHYPTAFRFNRPRSWALWPSSDSQREISNAIKDLDSNVTFELPFNVLTAAYDPILIKTPEGKDAVFAHAPAKLFEDLDTRKQELNFGFGIQSGAYTNGGRTNGVLFNIWLEAADGTKALVWSRLLNPLEQPQDRGTQWAKISLDPPNGARLIFQTDPNGNNASDWSYWADVRIE